MKRFGSGRPLIPEPEGIFSLRSTNVKTKRSEATMIEKANEIKKLIAQAPKSQIQKYQKHMDGLLRQIRASRNYFRYIVHVDMDMFYAACEELNDPSLKSIPFAVGSNMMLSTSNYIARKYGVRAGQGCTERFFFLSQGTIQECRTNDVEIPMKGQPGFIAKKLCSELGNVQLRIVPTNFDLYKELGIV